MTHQERRWLLAVLAVGLTLRVAWALYATSTPREPLHGDPFFYFTYGKDLARGDGYVNFLTGHPTAYYPVGYPGVLAGLFWIVWHTPLPDDLPVTATLLQAVLGTATVGLVFLIARRLFGTRTGIVAAAITALYPNLVFYTSTMALETVFIALSMAAVAIAVDHDWSAGPPGRGRLVAFGVVLGLSSLVRPFSLAFVLGLVAAVLVAAGWRRSVTATAWAVVPIVVILVPWTVRNVVELDAPIIFSTNMGDTLCIDRWEGASGGFRFTREGCAPPPEGPPSSYPADFEVEQNAENTRLALEFIREHPSRELLQVVRRARAMFADGGDGLLALDAGQSRNTIGDTPRTALEVVADATLYVLLALAVVGLAILARGWRRHPDRLFVLVAMLTLLVIPLLLWGNPRFHLPLVPFMAISAAPVVTGAWSRLRGRPRAAAVGR